MDSFKLDIKLLITIVTLAATLGGFYYTTQLRLDNIESSISGVEKQVKQLKKRNRKAGNQ